MLPFWHVLFSTLEPAKRAQQQLHSENRDLKNLLKDSAPGSNSRAEAAERSLFEIRKSLVSLAIKALTVEFANLWHVRTIVPLFVYSLMGKDTELAHTLAVWLNNCC